MQVSEKMVEAAQKAVNTRHGLTDEEMRKALEAALSTDAEPVTSKMVNDAWNAGKERHMTGTTEDFRAVVEAALSGKSEINTDRALQSRIDQYSVMGEDWLTYKATTAQLDFSKLYSHPLAKQFHDAIQTVDNLNCDTTSAVEQIKALSKSVEQEIDRLSVSPDGDVTEDMLNEGQERMCQLSSRTVFEDHIQAEVYKTMRSADPAFRPALSAQVQDVAEVSPTDYMRRHDAAITAYEANTPSDYRYSAVALRKAVDAAFAAAAAPAAKLEEKP